MRTWAALLAVPFNVCDTLSSRTKLLYADQIGYVHCFLFGIALILRCLKIIEYIQYSVTGRYQIHQRRHVAQVTDFTILITVFPVAFMALAFLFRNYRIAARTAIYFQFAYGLFVFTRSNPKFLVVLETTSASEMCYILRTES
jgi:hypothetical protein